MYSRGIILLINHGQVGQGPMVPNSLVSSLETCFQMQQLVSQPTTDHDTIIDLAFSSPYSVIGNIDSVLSDHKIITVSI